MVCELFFAPNFPIFQKSLDKERKQLARQLQTAMLYKQMQRADPQLLKSIKDKRKNNIMFFHYENTLLCLP